MLKLPVVFNVRYVVQFPVDVGPQLPQFPVGAPRAIPEAVLMPPVIYPGLLVNADRSVGLPVTPFQATEDAVSALATAKFDGL
jgi:hypothetical protein